MADFTPQQALWLLRVADGRPVECLDPALVRAGLVRAITPGQADTLRQYLGLARQAEEARRQARAVRRLRPLEALLPWVRRRRERQAETLGRQADDCEAQARGQWQYLSSQGLLDVDLELLSAAAEGSLAAITDSGRDLLRSFLCSEVFEREHVSGPGLRERVRVFVGLRDGLLARGFEPDPLLDLAAAVAGRSCGEVGRTAEFNGLAAAARWRSYDRLPLAALLALHPGEPQDVWDRFWEAYQAVKASGCPGSYETRLAAMILRRWGEVDEGACHRLWEIARRLRYHGWSLGQSTDPVAARLAGVRLSPTQIVARVVTLAGELERGSWTVGPYLDLAAAVAAGSNLHRLTAGGKTARLMEAASRYRPFTDRYDDALPRTGEDSRPTPIAALLALLPGELAGNTRRHRETTAALVPHVGEANAPALALMLLDSAYPDWFDCTPYTWEIGCLLQLADPGSAFGALGRMGPIYQGMAARAQMSRPEGSAAGPG